MIEVLGQGGQRLGSVSCRGPRAESKLVATTHVAVLAADVPVVVTASGRARSIAS